MSKRRRGAPVSQPMDGGAPQAVLDLVAAAERARSRSENESAVALYTQALDGLGEAGPESTPLRCDLLVARAASHGVLGSLPAQAADLEAARELADAAGDVARRSSVAASLARAQAALGRADEARRNAGEALAKAREVQDKGLEAQALLASAEVHLAVNANEPAREALEAALPLFRALGNRGGEADCLLRIGFTFRGTGRSAEGIAYFEQALPLFRALGDRDNEGRTLNAIGIESSDHAVQRAYYEQALAIFRAIGNRQRQAMIYNNLGLVYHRLGLYARARHYLQRAVGMARDLGAARDLVYYLESLARTQGALGQYGEARRLLEEGLGLAREQQDHLLEAMDQAGLGHLSLDEGRCGEARAALEAVAATFVALGQIPEGATVLAWLAQAQLALGDWPAADASSAEAVSLLAGVGDVASEFPPQDVWWTRYRVLRLRPHSPSEGEEESTAWACLDRAYRLVWAGIDTLSDEGLRRNYLNKVPANRDIVLEWTREAAARGISPPEPTARAGNLQDQLRRMMEISVRMNEQRETAGLLDYIMDEAVELNGAERSFLALLDAQGQPDFRVSRGVAPEEMPEAQALARAMLLRVAQTGAGVIDLTGLGKPVRSQLAVPLVAQGRLTGMLYADNRTVFGPYDQGDLDLLSVLAGQAATAIENARLYEGLEARVAERTAELTASNAALAQRKAELEIINSVQQGLASRLDFQGIVDLVGDRLRETFGGQNTFIALYDRSTGLLSFPYWVGHDGQRIDAQPIEFGSGLTSVVIETRRPLVLGTVQEQAAHGGVIVDDGSHAETESWLGVPVIAGDEAIGAIAVQDWPQDRYGESDVRLLSTLAASLGVSLQNARLFDETRRLFEAERQRAAELEIINGVGQALAAQLDMGAIYQVVGDKIRDIFDAQVVTITTYDWGAGMAAPRYGVEKGAPVHDEPYPLHEGGVASHLRRTRQPLLINELALERSAQYDMTLVPGTEQPRSLLFVPLVVGGETRGAISLQNIDREDAFSEADVRLLTTLSSSMGVAIENARLFEETRRLLDETRQRASELQKISDLGQMLVAQLDMQGIYEAVGDKLRDLFDAQVVTIVTYDRDSDLTTWRYSIEKGERQYPEPSKPGGFSGHILRTREPLLINRDLAARRAEMGGSVAAGQPARSYLGVPLIIGGEARGVITLQNVDREDAFSESDLRLLTTLSLNMSVALENARLFDETRRLLAETEERAAELGTINRISQALASELDLDALIHLVGEQVRQTFNADIAYVALLDPQTNLIHFRYAYGEEMPPLPYGQGLTSRIILSGQPILLNGDVARRYGELGLTPVGLVPRSFLGVPIAVGRRHVGVISVQSTQRDDRFDEADVRLLSTVAASVGSAIQNAQLYRETQSRAGEMAALTEIGREISETLDLPTVLERIATRAKEVLRANLVVLRLLEPDGSLPTVVAIGEEAEALRGDVGHLGVGITGAVAQSGVAEVLNDPLHDPRMVHIAGTAGGEEEESEAIIFAPLLSREKVMGVLTLWRDKPTEGPFTQGELDFAVGLARQAAIAITNARLFEGLQQAEAESRESRRQLADIIEFLPDATLVIDREGRVIAWNRAIEQMTGVKAADMLGQGDHAHAIPFYGERRPILIDLALAPLEEVQKRYAQVRREGNTLYGETYVPALLGQERYLFGTASVLRDAKGEVVGAIESIRDITDRKRAEQELQEARLAADQANSAKSAFLATMSHEIRTPMNAIIGMSGLLIDTPLSAEQRDYAETIRTSGDALLAIINDILDFSKIEAGKMDLEAQPFELRACVESALDLVAPRAAEKGLDLASMIDDDLPAAIVGDVTRLRQIMINLLTNAVKFTERGEVVLRVEALGTGDWGLGTGGQRRSQAAGAAPQSGHCELHFYVRDTGIGISPEGQVRLFQSFSQVDAATTRRYGGTGLGLAISRRLCEMMGGRIWVESELGVGSTFHFTIQVPAAPALAPVGAGEAPAQLVGRRLLVVDDNDTNRLIIGRQAQAWGMVTRDTRSPREALEWVHRGDPFDVAILDMRMAEMDGLELTAALRRERPREALAILICSSLGRREAMDEALGVAAFLNKPLKQSALYDALSTIFTGVAPAKEPARPALDRDLAQVRPLRILLAEDNAVNQKLALHLLRQMGYRVDVAGNGLEAIQALERQPYDVVLMDVQMPEMDGLEATRRICARWPAGERPRIVAMTANAMQGDREECLAAGMDDYIAKPVRVNELVDALARCPVKGQQGEGPMGDADVIDQAAFDVLVETTGGDAGFLNELMDTYLNDAPGLLAEMHRSLAAGDVEVFRRAAHSLKSNSASFGALSLSAMAKELEMMGKAGTLEGAAEKTARAEAEFARVKAALLKRRPG